MRLTVLRQPSIMKILNSPNVPGPTESNSAPLEPDRLLRWNDTHGQRFTHDFFKFPGKFHPPIVENILNLFKPCAVIDPMAGVGTVAVEAKAAGIPSLSIDVDPVGVFFARVKTTPISSVTLKTAWRSLRVVLDQMRRSEKQIIKFRFEDIAASTMRKYLARIEARHLVTLDYWFRKYVLVDYARIDHVILNGGLPHSSNLVRRFFTACLLSAVRRISNADPYPVSGVEITKQMRKKIAAGYDIDVVAEFERRVRVNIQRMESYVSYLREYGTLKTRADVVLGDCANISEIKNSLPYHADLILFSPPYCNAIEYWRRHRLEYFLGKFLTRQDIGHHHKKFIGRRAVGGNSSVVPPCLGHEVCDEIIQSVYRAGRHVKAWQLWHYFHDMKKRLDSFHAALPPKGHTVIIVGDSHTYGRKIPTAQILRDLAVKSGFVFERAVQYDIKNRTMQYPLKSGDSKIAEESIIVLAKPGQ
jgi:hypothetical protein